MTTTGTNVNTESAKAALEVSDHDPLASARADLSRMAPQFEMVLPAGFPADRLVRVLQTVVAGNPDMADPAPRVRRALLGASMTCAQLGLDPTPAIGHAYIYPFRDKKSGALLPTFVLGYKGAVWLASDNGVHLKSEVIREGDEYDVQFGTSGHIHHRHPRYGSGVERGRPLAYYCVATFADGSAPMFDVMTPAEVEVIRQGSPGRNSPAWTGHYDEMAKKTVLKRLAKSVPLGTKASEAMAHDGAVRMDAEPEAIGNSPTFADDDVAEAEVIEYDPMTGERLPDNYGQPTE